jgi:hypothetical protein
MVATLETQRTGMVSRTEAAKTVTPVNRPLNGRATSGDLPSPVEDAAFETLQGLVMGEYRERIGDLRSHVERLHTTLAELEHEIELLNDVERLAAKIQPSLAPAISASINESREEMVGALYPIIDRLIGTSVRESQDSMVDALYPIIGRLVTRAVTEALRDLAHRIDDQMRATLDIKRLMRRVQGRIAGLSEAELALREALPFQVLQIFLIHRETGLLLHVLSQDPALSADSDVISGMLTAIRDFADDAFGRGQEGELDEVQYGGRRIVIESARYAYVATVIEGIYPGGFRTQVRERLLTIEQQSSAALRTYDGDASRFEAAGVHLAPLLIKAVAKQPKESRPPNTVPLLRYEPELQPAFSVRLTFVLMIFVLLLTVWRVLHTLYSLPPIAAFVIEVLVPASPWRTLW